jgi:hypothetical protein
MPLRWVVQVKESLLGLTCDLRCELRGGEETLGLLRFSFSTRRWDLPQGQARTKEGTWLFRGYGTEVEIETDKGDRTLVRPYGPPRLFRGPFKRFHNPTLSLPNGHEYFLKRSVFLPPHYHEWLTADGTALLNFTFNAVGGPFMQTRIEGKAEVCPPGAALPELDLLIMLGWYLSLAPRGVRDVGF